MITPEALKEELEVLVPDNVEVEIITFDEKKDTNPDDDINIAVQYSYEGARRCAFLLVTKEYLSHNIDVSVLAQSIKEIIIMRSQLGLPDRGESSIRPATPPTDQAEPVDLLGYNDINALPMNVGYNPTSGTVPPNTDAPSPLAGLGGRIIATVQGQSQPPRPIRNRTSNNTPTRAGR